jgi:hypothetical protein
MNNKGPRAPNCTSLQRRASLLTLTYHKSWLQGLLSCSASPSSAATGAPSAASASSAKKPGKKGGKSAKKQAKQSQRRAAPEAESLTISSGLIGVLQHSTCAFLFWVVQAGSNTKVVAEALLESLHLLDWLEVRCRIRFQSPPLLALLATYLRLLLARTAPSLVWLSSVNLQLAAGMCVWCKST